jgi:hypothetical protein
VVDGGDAKMTEWQHFAMDRIDRQRLCWAQAEALLSAFDRGSGNMDVERCHAIIKSLADGVDPATGEVFAASHVCQRPDVVRALYWAAQEMERISKRERRLQRARLRLPENTGKAWSHDEDRLLLARFRSGTTEQDLATIHARTTGAIRARLEKLGQLGAAANDRAPLKERFALRD